MNACPILRRFSCGSRHAGQRGQETVLGLDHVQVGLEVVGELRDDRLRPPPCAAGRCRPGCRRAAGRSPGPAARRRPTESTPPDRPQITRLVADLRRESAAIVSSAKSPSFQVPAQPQTFVRKLRRNSRAVRRVRHFGMELQAVDRQPAMLHRGERAGRRSRPAARSRRRPAATWSPWLIQTCDRLGHAREQVVGGGDAALGAAVLPGRGALDPCRPGVRRSTASRSRCPARAARAETAPGRTSGPLSS